MTFKNIQLLYHTLKYLKLTQIYYRIYYTLRNKFFNRNYSKILVNDCAPLIWKSNAPYANSYLGECRFNFLNIEHEFDSEIDWNYSAYGKLWTYNLNYFDFLNQKDIQSETGIELIKNYINADAILIDGKDPYPISLRNINWIKFLSKHKISDAAIDQSLYNHYQILLHNLEYHLLGNHLLENGFSLLFGAYYFNDENLYKDAEKILRQELTEEILNDGAHFELSPMYHQILLHRLLDCMALIKLNNWKENIILVNFLEEKAKKMLSWLQTITFQDGNIPMVNDSAHNIAITSQSLFNYAESLPLKWNEAKLSNSGYRKVENEQFELFIDIGQVGPSYQPGHAHADTFSFILHVNNSPIIVDAGLSTYEINNTRRNERSTSYHNTVTVNDLDSSQVWSGFRVAKRADVKVLIDTASEISAVHNGYNGLNVKHKRTSTVENNVIIIEDELINSVDSKAYFHFHPTCKIDVSKNLDVISIDEIELSFAGNTNIKIEDYMYAQGFNKRIIAKKAVVLFQENLTTKIKVTSA